MHKISSVQRRWQLYSSPGKTGSGHETLLARVRSMQHRATVGEMRASSSGDPWIDSEYASVVGSWHRSMCLGMTDGSKTDHASVLVVHRPLRKRRTMSKQVWIMSYGDKCHEEK